MAPARPRITVLLAALAAAVVVPAPASAARGLVVGLADDGLKYEPQLSVARYRQLGLGGVRLTVTWRGETELGGTEAAWMDRAALAAGPGVRIVLSVYGNAALTPVDEAGRTRYCAFVRSALARYPAVRDVVIWNEVNKSHFWRPQFDDSGKSAAPAAYAALLARCWDVLHTYRADVNLITVHVVPRERQPRREEQRVALTGRVHPQGRRGVPRLETAAAPLRHGRPPSVRRGLGGAPVAPPSALDDDRRRATGTSSSRPTTTASRAPPSRTPGRCVDGRCAAIWYMEIGYQTTVSEHAGPYHGVENDERAVPSGGPETRRAPCRCDSTPAPDHGTQLAEAIRLAACQPYVGAYFNFHLRDEADLDRWQSGVYWADWAEKPSARVLADTIAEVAGGRVDCDRVARLVLASAAGGSAGGGGNGSGSGGGLSGNATGEPGGASSAAFPAPRTDVRVLRVAWPAARRFNWRHDEWRFRVAAGENVRYVAWLRRVRASSGALGGKSSAVLRASGRLRLGYFSFVRFPRKRLVPGASYRIEIVLASEAAAGRKTRLVGPRLRILNRPRRS